MKADKSRKRVGIRTGAGETFWKEPEQEVLYKIVRGTGQREQAKPKSAKNQRTNNQANKSQSLARVRGGFKSQIFGIRTSKSRKPRAKWVCNLGDDFQCSLALKMGFCKPGRHDARMYSFCTKDRAEIGTVETGAED